MIRSRITLAISLSLSVLLVACEGLFGGAAPSPSPSASVDADLARLTIVPTSPKVTPTLRTISESSATVPPTLAPVAVDGNCPATTNPPVPAKPVAFGLVISALNSLLNEGADANTAAAALKAWGYRITISTTQQTIGEAQSAKLLPNGGQQIVLTFADPNLPKTQEGDTPVYPGDLVVFGCAGGQYQLVYDALRDSAFPDGVVSRPHIVSNADVTGDGVGDLSFATGECVDSACYDALSIISSEGPTGNLHSISSAIEPILSPTWIFGPAGVGGKGKLLLAVEGITPDIEAGPQRLVTDTWAFDGTVFTRTASVQEKASYRIHALQDGDAAFRRKDFGVADTLYQQVIYDPNLRSWESMSSMKDEDRVLAAFALMRLVQTSAVRGDSAGTQTAYDALMAAAPAGAPGEIYSNMGKAFFEVFTQTDDYKRACDAAIEFAMKEPDSYGQLGPETFGYTNTDYAAEDMCLE